LKSRRQEEKDDVVSFREGKRKKKKLASKGWKEESSGPQLWIREKK